MCWLFHRWSKWTDKRYGPLLSNGEEVGAYVTQERRCQRCHILQLRDART